MSMYHAGTGTNSYTFGQFRLDLARGTLLRGGTPVSLRPKSFEVLHQLVLHAGQLLSREELLRAVWPNVIVSDDSLTQCLIEIRRALVTTTNESFEPSPGVAIDSRPGWT